MLSVEIAMKMLAALIAGLFLSLTTFVAGLVIAITFLTAGEPDHPLDGKDVTTLWSTQPVAIDSAAQTFERLPARAVPKAQSVASLSDAATGARAAIDATPAEARSDMEPGVDPVTTGSIERKVVEADAARDASRAAAHSDWCQRRYRSYDAATDSYRPYGGGARVCQSPYSTLAATEEPAEQASEDLTADNTVTAEMEQAAYTAEPIYADGDHVQSCMARYRSYRPEDNSYQPFAGGPRRQCE